MGEVQSALLFVGLFLLRFGVPLLIIAGLGYLLVRLDNRWQAEAEAARAAETEHLPAGKPETARRPAIPAPGITPALLADAPCWVIRGCDPAQRAMCPAYLHPELPCWMARLKAEDSLPALCPDCTIFAETIGRD